MHPKNERSPVQTKRFDILLLLFFFFVEKITNVFKTKNKKKDLHIHHEFQRSESELANLKEILVCVVGKHLDYEDLVFVVSLIKHPVEVDLHVQPW